jgi:hypothetical protein
MSMIKEGNRGLPGGARMKAGCSSLSPNPQLHKSSSHKSHADRTRLGDSRLLLIESSGCKFFRFGLNFEEGKEVRREAHIDAWESKNV